jgi:hypothetical protein
MPATYEASLVSVTMRQTAAPILVEVCGLKWTDLTISDDLSGAGSCMLQVQVDSIDPSAAARLARPDLYPCELWIRRTVSESRTVLTGTFLLDDSGNRITDDGGAYILTDDGATYRVDTVPGASTLVFSGPVIACRINDRNLTISAGGLLAYLDYWIRETDYAVTATDQATIVQQLIDQTQALDYGHRGLVTTALTATGVTRQLTLNAVDGKSVLPVITEMGAKSNGFDLTIDPTTRQVRMWSPRKGNDLTASVILDRRSIGNPNLSWSVAAGLLGSEAFVSSSSSASIPLTKLASNTTLRSTFGRTYVTRSVQDVSEQATLDAHASRALDDVGTVAFTITPDLIPVTGLAYGDFSVGDLLTYDYDAGLGRQTFPVRVATIEASFGSGRELLKVGVV